MDTYTSNLSINKFVFLQAVWSISNMCMGLGMLSGPPLAGYLHDVFDSYPPVFVFMSICILLTAILLFLSQKLHSVEKRTQLGTVELTPHS